VPGHGQRMVATRTIPAGTELFCEDALFFIKTDVRDLSTVCGLSFAHFCAQTPEVQARILAFYAPVDDAEEEAIRKLAEDELGAEHEKKELFVKIGLIMKANCAVAQQPSETEAQTCMVGLGLYELGCRANHSCEPNACWLDAPGVRSLDLNPAPKTPSSKPCTRNHCPICPENSTSNSQPRPESRCLR
jgi:hypothetical protein